MSEEKIDTTVVQEVDINLAELLGTGADQVMTPGEQTSQEKKHVFSPMTADTTFLDKPIDKPIDKVEKTPEEIKAEEEAKANKTPEEIAAEAEAAAEDVLAPGVPPELTPEELAEQERNKGGRPTALVTAAKNLIKDKLLTPFVDKDGNEESLDNYTAEDFQELIKANMENLNEKKGQEVAEQFFNSLPSEMQQAYQYIASGGTDLKSMFGALAASSQTRDIDISTVEGRKYAVRSYLQATNYGTPEEIEDEIYTLEDRGDLEKKANQFKPKLDAMQEQIIANKLAETERANKQRQAQSQQYIENVYSTLEKGELNGVKIDNKTQNMLYSGLVESNYPSVNGRQTNMLGHLLEKYQWVEPNHGLIAEALWLLSDPEGYRAKLGEGVEKEVSKETLRTLKTEQATKNAGTVQEDPAPSTIKRTTGVSRPKRNFFSQS